MPSVFSQKQTQTVSHSGWTVGPAPHDFHTPDSCSSETLSSYSAASTSAFPEEISLDVRLEVRMKAELARILLKPSKVALLQASLFFGK